MEVQELKREIRQLETTLDEMSYDIYVEKSKNNFLKEHIDDLEDKIKMLEEEIDDLIDENNEMYVEALDMEAELEELRYYDEVEKDRIVDLVKYMEDEGISVNELNYILYYSDKINKVYELKEQLESKEEIIDKLLKKLLEIM